MTYQIDSIIVSISTGIHQNSSLDKGSTVFPNPFNSKATFQFDYPLNNAELSFINLYGQKI